MNPLSTRLVEQTEQRKQEVCQASPASDTNLSPPDSETTGSVRLSDDPIITILRIGLGQPSHGLLKRRLRQVRQ